MGNVIALHSIFSVSKNFDWPECISVLRPHTHRQIRDISMDTKPAKSLISVSQIIGNPWFFTFVADVGRKVLKLRIGAWKFQDMLGNALDEISENLHFFSEKGLSNSFPAFELENFGVFSSGDMTVPNCSVCTYVRRDESRNSTITASTGQTAYCNGVISTFDFLFLFS